MCHLNVLLSSPSLSSTSSPRLHIPVGNGPSTFSSSCTSSGTELTNHRFIDYVYVAKKISSGQRDHRTYKVLWIAAFCESIL